MCGCYVAALISARASITCSELLNETPVITIKIHAKNSPVMPLLIKNQWHNCQ